MDSEIPAPRTTPSPEKLAEDEAARIDALHGFSNDNGHSYYLRENYSRAEWAELVAGRMFI